MRRRFRGLKLNTEDVAATLFVWRGRGASLLRRSCTVRYCGAIGSENVGMSNRKPGESPGRRKPKVSLAMTINQGLGGPNRVPEGVLGMDSRLIFRPLNIFSMLLGV